MMDLKRIFYKDPETNYYVVVFEPSNTANVGNYVINISMAVGIDPSDKRVAICFEYNGSLYYKNYLSLRHNKIALDCGLPFPATTDGISNLLKDEQIIFKVKLEPEEYFKPFKIKEDDRFAEFFI